MQLEDFIGGKITEFRDKLSNVFTDNGKGLTVNRATAAEAAEASKAAQEAKAAVDPTVAYFKSRGELTIAEGKMTVAALEYVGEEATAFVETIEKAVDTAEILNDKQRRAAVALQNFQLSRERMGEDRALLDGKFARMMPDRQDQRAIAPPTNQRRFSPSR